MLRATRYAAVPPIAGTTRDKVSETIQIQGIPLNIIDTAGIRAPGVERFWFLIQPPTGAG